MDIFYKSGTSSGSVAVVRLPQTRGDVKLFLFQDPAFTFRPELLITAVRYSQTAAAQFQSSLDNVIYVYAFGDAMGELVIEGLAFPSGCDRTVRTAGGNGLRKLLDFYRDYRISGKVARVRAAFANEVLNGYLVEMGVRTMDASSGIHQFTLLIRTVPPAFTAPRDVTKTEAAGGGTMGESAWASPEAVGPPERPAGLED